MNEDAKKFYLLMAQDKDLQEKAKKILDEIDSKGLDRDARNDAYDGTILELAKEKGFVFTLEEAKALNEEIKKSFSVLSDEDLDQVAGGMSINLPTGFAAATYAVFPNFGGNTGIDWSKIMGNLKLG